MKTAYTTQEGVKMNSELSFGHISEILDAFRFFLETTEGMSLIDIQYYYRIMGSCFFYKKRTEFKNWVQEINMKKYKKEL